MNHLSSKVVLVDADQNVDQSANEKGYEVPSYLPRLTKQRLLSAEEEKELARRSQNGDLAARDILVEANMRLVMSFVENYRNHRISREDLIQEGALGLIKAVQNFDPSKGFRFSTYATQWIKQAIWRALDCKTKSIRLPVHISEALRKMEKFREKHIREYGEEPSVEILAQVMGTNSTKIKMLQQVAQEPLSLDMMISSHDDTTLMSLIDDKSAADPEGTAIQKERNHLLNTLFLVLTPREREIMRMRMGMDGDASHVLQQIGQALHLSRERVRQIEMQALRKLKYAAKQSDLMCYLTA